jgi:hypothetical protein
MSLERVFIVLESHHGFCYACKVDEFVKTKLGWQVKKFKASATGAFGDNPGHGAC